MPSHKKTTSRDGTTASTAKSLARTMRNAPKNATLSPDQKRSSKAAVSGAVASTVGKRSGTASTPAQKRAGVTTARTPGQHPAPKLGRHTAVSSPVTDGRYGTAKAKNNSKPGPSGAVSGKSDSWGTAPAKNQGDRSRPYGT